MRKVVCFILLLLIVPAFNAHALTCSSTENLNLKKEANNVEISYDLEDLSKKEVIKLGSNKTSYNIPKYKFTISVYNIKDDIYVKVSNNINSDIETIYPEFIEKGTYSFEHLDYSNIYEYKLSVYSNKDECKNELIGTKKMVVPKYNPYSEYEYCKTSNEDFCKKFIKEDYGFTTDETFLNHIKELNKSNEEKPLKEQLKDNKGIIIAVTMITLVVSAGFVIVSQLLRRRHDKELWNTIYIIVQLDLLLILGWLFHEGSCMGLVDDGFRTYGSNDYLVTDWYDNYQRTKLLYD